MKVSFLVTEPDMPNDFCQQPIEALYAATILNDLGHEARVHDLRTSSMGDLPDAAPDIVFVVTQTYDLSQCYSITLRNSARSVRELRSRWPATPIVATGVHASLEPAMTVRDIGCDAALPGELESAIPWLVDRMADDPDAHRGDLSRAPRLADPARLPVPDFDLVDLDPYYGEIVTPGHQSIYRGRTGLVFANRGCPYSCSYCFVWFGAKIRQRRPEQVVAELVAQRSHGIRDFFFLDYTFTLQRNWVLELCRLIDEKDLDISWICQTRCERVDAELLSVMRGAGCSGVFYGVESPWIAESDMHKPTPRAMIDHTIEITRKAGLVPFLFILIGLENDDPQRAEALLSWLSTIPAKFDASTLLPRPHTSLWSRYLAGLPTPESWEEYQRLADELQSAHFRPLRMREFRQAIMGLPNYVGNSPTAIAGRSSGT